jgi:inositol phosphorylceramide mannosyltransferase catalytic subunit
MDTKCHKALPIDDMGHVGESGSHVAIFKSTTPTGVTNDLMLSSAKHPVMKAAMHRLPEFYTMTWFWSRLQPYCNIMLSAGPLFLSLTLTDVLLQKAPEERPHVQVVNETELAPYITDLESCTWHAADARILMWIGHRPRTWIPFGVLGLFMGLLFINTAVVRLHDIVSRARFLPSHRKTFQHC